jgi:hypothetical protein
MKLTFEIQIEERADESILLEVTLRHDQPRDHFPISDPMHLYCERLTAAIHAAVIAVQAELPGIHITTDCNALLQKTRT